MVAGRDAATFGEAKNSWLTGTAAWTFVDVSQYILGIQPTLAGLKIDPCIPHEMDGFTLRRVWRGVTYYRKEAARSGLLLFLFGLYTPACCFTNQKTPLPCCVRSRIREYFLCAACQVWLYREHCLLAGQRPDGL